MKEVVSISSTRPMEDVWKAADIRELCSAQEYDPLIDLQPTLSALQGLLDSLRINLRNTPEGPRIEGDVPLIFALVNRLPDHYPVPVNWRLSGQPPIALEFAPILCAPHHRQWLSERFEGWLKVWVDSRKSSNKAVATRLGISLEGLRKQKQRSGKDTHDNV